jgi:hypothetical protein
MAGCGKKIEVAVERGFTFKEITVRCGNTSPHGSPWLCDSCEKKEGHRDWRYEAEMAGEAWGPEDY